MNCAEAQCANLSAWKVTAVGGSFDLSQDLAYCAEDIGRAIARILAWNVPAKLTVEPVVYS